MQSLRDKARELVSIAEGELLKKEAIIIALRRENKKAREEVAAAEAQQQAVRSEKCRVCIYKLAALRSLDEENKRAVSGSLNKGV